MNTTNNQKARFVAWNPSAEALRPAIVGMTIIALSLVMRFLSPFWGIMVRDLLMIFVCGIVYPIHRIKAEEDFNGYGLTIRRWPMMIAINLVLALALVWVFVKEVPLPVGWNPFSHLGEVSYIMLAGVFETVVFYAYIRTAVERSFGILPGILVAAVCYSFHHAGFQPEFSKLIVVGLMYALTFRLAGGALAMFPFFWGVGATWDVLVQSQVVSDIAFPVERSIVLLIAYLFVVAILILTRTGKRVPEGGAIESDSTMSTDEYGRIMKDRLGGEYIRFALRANEYLSLPKGARVLEIGSGPGWAGIELLKLKSDLAIVAIEPSADMRSSATKNATEAGVADRISYEEGVAEDLSQFTDDSFDAVISRDSLHHWEDPARAFSNIERVVGKKGGVFIVDNKRNLTFLEWLLVFPFGKRIAGPMIGGWRNSIASGYTPRELQHILSKASLCSWKAAAKMLEVVVLKRRSVS